MTYCREFHLLERTWLLGLLFLWQFSYPLVARTPYFKWAVSGVIQELVVGVSARRITFSEDMESAKHLVPNGRGTEHWRLD